jgi:hypothetical protein
MSFHSMRQVFECLCSLDGRRICGHEQVLRLNLLILKYNICIFTILILYHLIDSHAANQKRGMTCVIT